MRRSSGSSCETSCSPSPHRKPSRDSQWFAQVLHPCLHSLYMVTSANEVLPAWCGLKQRDRQRLNVIRVPKTAGETPREARCHRCLTTP